MGKKRNKRNNNQISNEDTLVNKYKKLFVEFDKQGQDITSAFEQFGGKDAFLQHIQDIEDDVAGDKTEIFKQAYGDGDIRRCVRSVINMVKDDWILYKRGIRKVLYSEGNLLKNPLNYSFNADDYDKTIQILTVSICNIDRLSREDKSGISKEMADSCCKELVQLLFLYECLYNNRIENEKRLNESAFLKLSLPQIVQSFLVFFQSQYNLAREEMARRWQSQEYITGFESQVASEDSSINPDLHVSFADNFEQLIEDMDTLFRYVFYLKNNATVSIDDIKEDFKTPYESPEYSTLDVLSMLDVLFSRMEMGFRYSGWNIGTAKDPDGKKGYCFWSSDEKAFRIHIAAGLRNKHNFMIETTNESMKASISRKPKDIVLNYDGAEHLPGRFYSEYLTVSVRMNNKDIESFHFDDKEYIQLKSYAEPLIESTKKRNKPYYFTVQFNDICVEEYLDAYVFLYTLSKVVYCSAIKSSEQEDFVLPVSLEYLYREYASVSGLKKDKAKRLIDFYVFDNNVSRNKRLGDLFTNPLVKVGAGMILLSEGLINQVNLDRNIEVLLDRNNVNIAPIGKELEKRLINKLQGVENLAINTNNIEFMAYDGRNVEFDFIAVLDDYLIVLEMKSLLQPYDDDELYRRRKYILEGVDQVNRRVRIVKNDWEEIKGLASIKLPENPYEEKHIIKIVCTDVYDFTGMEFDGVIVTDDATIIKYFTNPYVHGMLNKQEDGIKILKKRVLWGESGKPSAEEFIQYLQNPDTMDYYLECVEPEWKVIPLFEGYEPMAFQDMVVKEDPLKKLAEKHGL